VTRDQSPWGFAIRKATTSSRATDGANGFVAGSRDVGIRHYTPFQVDRPAVDSTGAGDLFRAGMLFGLDRGWPIEHCLRFASAAGCLACRTLGATSQVPTVQEIETVVRDS
jgi:sugar/nucleoside kinase (ribokinase family)